MVKGRFVLKIQLNCNVFSRKFLKAFRPFNPLVVLHIFVQFKKNFNVLFLIHNTINVNCVVLKYFKNVWHFNNLKLTFVVQLTESTQFYRTSYPAFVHVSKYKCVANCYRWELPLARDDKICLWIILCHDNLIFSVLFSFIHLLVQEMSTDFFSLHFK